MTMLNRNGKQCNPLLLNVTTTTCHSGGQLINSTVLQVMILWLLRSNTISNVNLCRSWPHRP